MAIPTRESIDDTEQLDVVVKNIWSESVPRGGLVVWAPAHRKAWVSRPSTATLSLFAGVARDIILPQGYGKIITRGFTEILMDTSVQSTSGGNIITPLNASFAGRVLGPDDMNATAAFTGTLIAAHDSEEVDITCTGARAGMFVLVTTDGTFDPGAAMLEGRVVANNTVRVVVRNVTAGNVTVPSCNLYVSVLPYPNRRIQHFLKTAEDWTAVAGTTLKWGYVSVQ